MPCYHPLIGIFKGEYNTATGKKIFHVGASIDPMKDMKIHPGSVMIPCGKCIGCRLEYSRAWADRMMLELEVEKKAVFITLTYNNENMVVCKEDENGLPLFGTLCKRDVQLFMKRLRKRFSDKRLRFYCAGEYGTKTLRPHYHMILFGLSLSDIHDLKEHGMNELGQKYYISDEMEKIWSNGFVLICDVSWKTCAYVARYITKKLNGKMNEERFSDTGQFPEFSLMSRKPGIGASYLEKNPDCLDFASINLSTPEGGLKIQLPKYYIRMLEKTDVEKYEKLKAERKQYAEDAMLLKLGKTDLSLVEYLENCENQKLKKIKSLKRK